MKTEEQEDADIVQDEIAQDNVGDWPTHFTTQPSCIEGGNMRWLSLSVNFIREV